MRPRLAALLAALVVGATVMGVAGSATGAAADDPTAKIVARYPGDAGEMVEEPVVTRADVESVGELENTTTGWAVRVTLTERGAASYAESLVDARFTDVDGVRSCTADSERNDEGYCLLTVVDGEVVEALSLGPSLADAIQSGEFETDPVVLVAVDDEASAARLARAFGDETDTTSATGTTTEVTLESTTQESADDDAESDGFAPGPGPLSVVLAGMVALAVAHYRGRSR